MQIRRATSGARRLAGGQTRRAPPQRCGIDRRDAQCRHGTVAVCDQGAVAVIELRRRRLTASTRRQELGHFGEYGQSCRRPSGLSQLSALEPLSQSSAMSMPRRAIWFISTPKSWAESSDRASHHPQSRDSVDGAGLGVSVRGGRRPRADRIYANERDERRDSAIAFLRAMLVYFASLGVTVRRILTDNGSAFRSKRFARACQRLGLQARLTRPDRPQTNGKAERFIRSALREWAYGIAYGRSSERTAMLRRWTHHYNWHRPHHGIGGNAPISRLNRSRNNLLTARPFFGECVSSWASPLTRAA